MDGLKLKASSVLEVVVALVVIMIIFGIAMLVQVNVTASGSQGIKFEAAYLMEKEAAATIAEKSFHDEEIIGEGFTIFKDCNSYQEASDLMEVHLEAVNSQGALLGTYREIVLLQDE